MNLNRQYHYLNSRSRKCYLNTAYIYFIKNPEFSHSVPILSAAEMNNDAILFCRRE